MALNAYLSLKGQKQGAIKGSVTQKGREGKIMVIAVSHDVVSPRDVASGLPIGQRQHTPLKITKEVDRSSPALASALINNENLTELELQFWRPLPTGTEVQHYTLRLTNANIASIGLRMLNNKDPNLMKFTEFEEITFTYQKIEWVWNLDGGFTVIDDWTARA